MSQSSAQAVFTGQDCSPQEGCAAYDWEEGKEPMKTIKTTDRVLPDTYFALVKEFPLTHIRDDEHLKEAQEAIDQLLQEELDEGAQAYLDALTDLVEIYED